MENEDNMVLCAANSYNEKYFFNKYFDLIPEDMKEELHVICVLFASEVGGIFMMYFEDDGELCLKSEHDEDDLMYDEVSAGLMISEIRRTRAEMIEQLEQFYRAFVLKEDQDAFSD